MATTITSVNIPEHKFPHTEVNINDNTIRTYVNRADEYCRTACVFLSPKGKDGIQTITGGIDEFTEKYGNGSVAEYGQAFLNARTLAETNSVTMHCLRLTADDATVANLHVYIRYKIEFGQDAADKPAVEEITGPDGEPTGVYKLNRTKASSGAMKVYFVAKSDDKLTDIKYLTKNKQTYKTTQTVPDGSGGSTLSEVNEDLGLYCNPDPQRIGDGWYELWLFSVASLGKGKCGNALSINLSTNDRLNRSTDRINYQFDIYESGVLQETATICFDEDAIIRNKSLFIENVINGEDGREGSDLINVAYNDNALSMLWETYQTEINPLTSLDYASFDPFLGIDKGVSYGRSYTKYYSNGDAANSPNENDVPNMDGYYFITGEDDSEDDAYPTITTDTATINGATVTLAWPISLSTPLGVSLNKGDDGAFSKPTATNGRTKEEVQAAITAKIIKIFRGEEEYDRELNKKVTRYPYDGIMSTSRFPIDFFLDANYEYDAKIAIAEWCQKRKHDFVLYLDNGTSNNMLTKASSYITKVDMDEATNFWNIALDSYFGKIKDPYNQRIIEVTSTYNLARNLPLHWRKYNGKHIPYAGSTYGIIDSYLPNTVFPLMDKDLDADHMDQCVAEHVNYAQINSKGDVIRGTQSSRYPVLGDADTMSNLTELNNAHIVLDIKKDCEKLLESFAFNFNEDEDVIKFNRRAEVITAKYAAAQVKKISATFERTAEEAEYGILHLYITVIHKALVKIAIVDIDVNRGVEE